MASVNDQDRFFHGQLNASSPKHLLEEGTIQRLFNGRFIEGAISNGIGFDEIEPIFSPTKKHSSDGVSPFTSPVTHTQILQGGDVQLVAPLDNIAGHYLVLVISGILYKLDLDSYMMTVITPTDSCLPASSSDTTLSFTDNDGDTLGVGGYLVIYNYPNKSLIINHETARLAMDSNYEVPPSRMGATGGSRMFTISGDNLMYASDPLGGASSLAPLTFQETLDPSGTYTGQIFTIGSSLDMAYITSICRLPRYMSASQDFLAHQLIVSTRNKKYVIAAAAPRSSWDSIQFISYAGSTDGIAGPLASTNIGDMLIYLSTTGRIKTLGQDQERDTGLAETFMDDPLGQYLCPCEANYHFRDWYRTLDHSRGIIKFTKDRVYVTVYPIEVPAIDSFGNSTQAPSHRAMAIGSLDSTTKLGPNAAITWEGFYNWLQPIGMATIKDDLYIVSKDNYGRIRFYKENFTKLDNHTTTIYTRGYFASFPGRSKSILEGSLYFRRLGGHIHVSISYLIDGEWVCGSSCGIHSKLHKFSFRKSRCKSDSASIPLKIDIDHNGCRFELESIFVSGEAHREEK